MSPPTGALRQPVIHASSHKSNRLRARSVQLLLGMTPVRPLAALAALAISSGCYQQETTAYSTFPEPTMVAGPPGGEIDPAWQQSQYPGYPDGYPAGYPDGYPAGTPADVAAMQTAGELTPSSDPSAAGYVMGAPTNSEIDQTLSGYGEWIEVDGYGLVWRPYVSAVGLDFTPYESCGSWVWTDDWGWTFACEWDWGWLPFHYGRWGWFEDYWAWQPGYEWSAGWVEWRSGDDYCGWRPLTPEYSPGYWDSGVWVVSGGGQLTGAAYTSGGWNIRDHRTNTTTTWTPHHTKAPALYDSHWRFTKREAFGKKIRPNEIKNPMAGLRSTSLTPRPPMKGTTRPVNAASIMRGRIAMKEAIAAQNAQRSRPFDAPISRPYRVPPRAPGIHRDDPTRSPQQAPTRGPDPAAIDRMWPRPPPTTAEPDRPRSHPPVDREPKVDYRQPPLVPSRDFPGERTPMRGHDGGRPSRPDPSNHSRGGDGWSRPQRPTAPPPSSRGGDYSPPSRSSSSSKSSSSDDRPSRSTSSSSGNWSPPSRSSSSSGGGHSAPSRSSGGGGFSGGGSRGGGMPTGGGGGGRRGR